MLKIENNNNYWEFEFYGLKIIDCQNTAKFFKEFKKSKITINNRTIKNDDIIYINELTKISDLLSFNKKSFLIENIVDIEQKNNLINKDNLTKIIRMINDKYNYEILEECDGDLLKIIGSLIQLTSEEYLNKEILKILLSNNYNSSKLFIIDNISWINIEDISIHLNEHHFIFLTNDFRNYIKKINDLEEVLIVKDNLEISELYDSQKICAYLEKNINEPINNKQFNIFINEKDSLFSLRLLSLIRKI